MSNLEYIYVKKISQYNPQKNYNESSRDFQGYPEPIFNYLSLDEKLLTCGTNILVVNLNFAFMNHHIQWKLICRFALPILTIDPLMAFNYINTMQQK